MGSSRFSELKDDHFDHHCMLFFLVLLHIMIREKMIQSGFCQMNRSHFRYLGEEEIKYRKLEAYINTGRTTRAMVRKVAGSQEMRKTRNQRGAAASDLSHQYLQ